MRLTGKQIGQLRDVILDAYTDPEELRMDILVGMEINLTHIASGATYQTRVFTLIERFQAEERLEEFVDILVEKRPRNSTLKQYQQLMQNVQSEADLVKTQVKEENRQTKQITQIIKELEPEIRSHPELVEVPEQVTDVLPNYVLPVPPKEDSGNSLSTLELETVYVDSRGQITTKKDVSVSYYEQPIPNNEDPICMVSIPQGEFWMGSPENEEGRFPDESPQHLVKVPAFFMSQTPVTQAQWKAIASLPQEGKELKLAPSRFKGDNLPVENVRWQDAIEFCARLSRLTGRNYRLPSEAEWEYACRAIPNQVAKKSNQIPVYPPFHFGETLTSNLANYAATAIYQQEVKGEYRQKTTPVRSFPPNAFGLYDMHGNVWEWCLDPWHGNYKGAPGDGRVWDEKDNDNHYHDILSNINVLIKDNRAHVLRGGSWDIDPRDCRSAYRYTYGYLGGVNVIVGFRPVFSFQDSSPLHS
jgi:formylglycine-generating enzyme required for sulfatase activity